MPSNAIPDRFSRANKCVPHPADGCSITAGYARPDFRMNEPLDMVELTAGIARLMGEAVYVEVFHDPGLCPAP